MGNIDRKLVIAGLKELKGMKEFCIEEPQGLEGEGIWFHDVLDFCINSLETDEAYQLEYEKPTTTNDLAHNLCDSCINYGCEFQSGIVRTKCAFYMPPQDSTTKNDLGVDKFDKAINQSDLEEWIMGTFSDWCVGDVRLIMNHMDEMPPVTPIRPKGHWIVQPSNKEQGERDFIWWKCSECGQVIFSETEHDRLEFHAFCGRCGSDNREVVEE